MQIIHEVLNLITTIWRSIYKILKNEEISFNPKGKNISLKSLKDSFIEDHSLSNLNRTNWLDLLQNHKSFIGITRHSSKTHIKASDRCVRIHFEGTLTRERPLGLIKGKGRRRILVDLPQTLKTVPTVERFHHRNCLIDYIQGRGAVFRYQRISTMLDWRRNRSKNTSILRI